MLHIESTNSVFYVEGETYNIDLKPAKWTNIPASAIKVHVFTQLTMPYAKCTKLPPKKQNGIETVNIVSPSAASVSI